MTGWTKIIWRDAYSEGALEAMERLGTVPREEIEIDTRFMDGAEIAAAIANDSNGRDSENFREGGDIVILEPEEFAGTYKVSVDYEPHFYAYKHA